jgi:hypothetical protein
VFSDREELVQAPRASVREAAFTRALRLRRIFSNGSLTTHDRKEQSNEKDNRHNLSGRDAPLCARPMPRPRLDRMGGDGAKHNC